MLKNYGLLHSPLQSGISSSLSQWPHLHSMQTNYDGKVLLGKVMTFFHCMPQIYIIIYPTKSPVLKSRHVKFQSLIPRTRNITSLSYLHGTNNNTWCCFVLTSYKYLTFSFSITSAQTRSFFSSSIFSLISRICLIAIYLASSVRTCSRTSGITFKPESREDYKLNLIWSSVQSAISVIARESAHTKTRK